MNNPTATQDKIQEQKKNYPMKVLEIEGKMSEFNEIEDISKALVGYNVNEAFTVKSVTQQKPTKYATRAQRIIKAIPIEERSKRVDMIGTDRFIYPPYNELGIVTTIDHNVWHTSCIKVITWDAIMQGRVWKATDDNESSEALVPEELEADMMNINALNESIEMVLRKAFIDYEYFGRMALEVIRDKKGDFAELRYIKVMKLRPHSSIFDDDPERPVFHYTTSYYTGYDSNQSKTGKYYKKFGVEGDYDSRTGYPFKNGVDKNFIANEILYIVEHHPLLYPFYGMPKVVTAIGATYGFNKIKLFNNSFFEGMGTLKCLVKIDGDMDTDGENKIKKFLETKIQGSKQKTLAVFTNGEGSIEIVDLQQSPLEGSFHILSKDNRDEIIVTYRIPPYRIGLMEVGKLAGNLGVVADKIYDSTTLAEIRGIADEVVNDFIITHPRGMNQQGWKTYFKPISTADQQLMLMKANDGYDRNVINKKEYADITGITTYPKKDDLGTDSYIKVGYINPEDMNVRRENVTQLEDIKEEIDKVFKFIAKQVD